MSDKHLDIQKNTQNELFNNWMTEIKENPRFKDDAFSQNDLLESHSKTFLNQVLSGLDVAKTITLKKSELDPILNLWHHLLKEQQQKGLSTKDLAMLIFSLKSSLLNDTAPKNKAITEKLSPILDILGLLTFEIYSVEKEHLISQQNSQIEYLQNSSQLGGKLIGNSPEMKAIFQAIGMVLENDMTVLLQGESGTGKDLIASVIHQNSSRKNKPFVTLNCGAIPKDLVESELFGYEKGAFTGADSQKIGKFELAHTGTLFLDEIGELPLDMQVKLLRALQNQEIERVGGTEKIKIDIRVIAATNQNLKEAVDEKRFRLDLFYRLNVFPIHVPPLRQRKDDILPLAQFFIDKFATHYQTGPKTLSQDAQNYLVNHPWDGNIRELENLCHRCVVISQGSIINQACLAIEPGKFDAPLLEAEEAPKQIKAPIIPLDQIEENAIINALDQTDFNVQKTAKKLGVSRSTLYNKLEKYKIDIPEE